MDHFNLPLLLQRFPADRLVFSACRAGVYGFAMVDSVRGSGAASSRKMSPCCVRDWQPARTGSAPTLPSKGSFWVRRQPSTCFLLSCSRYRIWSPAAGSGTLLSDRNTFLLYNRPQKRCGWGQVGWMKQKESNRQHSGRRPVAIVRHC